MVISLLKNIVYAFSNVFCIMYAHLELQLFQFDIALLDSFESLIGDYNSYKDMEPVVVARDR